MINVSGKGNFKKTSGFLNKLLRGDIFSDLDLYGQRGVDALAAATPVDSGLTASSWRYKILTKKGSPGILWYNTNIVDGTPVAILIQYGHGTGTGGYVQGIDFINPTMRPIFHEIASDVWKKVRS